LTISRKDFQQWMSLETTSEIRNLLVSEAQHYATLNYSLADETANEGELPSLEKLGLDSAMRMSVVKGIELFTNTDNLAEMLDFPEELEVEE